MAVPSMAVAIATKPCGSVSLPLKPSDMKRTNIEIPMAIQTEPMARLMLVRGWMALFRAARAAVSAKAAIMVTGQAR